MTQTLSTARTIRRGQLSRQRTVTYICLLAPCLLLFVATVIVPFIQGIPYSFTDFNLMNSQSANFVGLKWYRNLFDAKLGKTFWKAVGNTFQFTGMYILLSNLIGLMMALLLKKSTRLNNICRTLVFMPYVLGLITAAFAWRNIYNLVLNPYLGIASPLGTKGWAMFGIAIISSWRTSGYCMLIYLAALQGVPMEYYEAASVEGANSVQQFFKITVPMIVPAFASNVSLLLAWGLKVFEVVNATTRGGPSKDETLTMSMFVYNNIFTNWKGGYGQASAIIMTLILLAVSFLVSSIFRRLETN